MLRIGVAIITLGAIALLISALASAGFWGIVVPLFFVVGSIGIIGANAVSCTLQPFPDIAGTAAATFGFIQMMTGALVGAGIGLFYDGTVLPMALIIILMALASLGCCLFLAGKNEPLIECT